MLEETGHSASQWIHLASNVVDANRGSGMAHLYLARGARAVAQRHSDDLEEQQLISLSRAEMRQALMAGEFKSLAWTTGVALALLHLGG